MPDFPESQLVPLARSVIKRVESIESMPAYGSAPPLARCPLFAVRAAINDNGLALKDDKSQVRKELRLYGPTPFVRFLGMYLKKVEAAGKLIACDDTKYVAFAASIAQYLPKAVEENGVAGYQVAVTINDGEGYVTKHMHLSEAKMWYLFPNEVSHSETEATSGSDDEEDVVYSEARVRSVWHQLELERYKDKNGTANVTNLSAGFCSAEPAA